MDDDGLRKENARLRAELEELRQTQARGRRESLSVLAGGVAHTFNNLLVGILGHADLALLDLALSSPARPAIREIKQAALRAAELSKQMLAYSGHGSFVVEPLLVDELLLELEQALRATLPEAVTLRLELAGDLPVVQGDAAQLRQAMLELITNAVEATDVPGGIVRVRTSTVTLAGDEADLHGNIGGRAQAGAGDYVEIRVIDEGCGMSAVTRSRLFEPFHSTKFTGRGLGLAAVAGIMEGHGGAVRLQSAAGRGTELALLFPISEEALRQQRRRVLLWVDDEQLLRSVGIRLLGRAGFACSVVDSLDEASRRAAEGFEVFVFDAELPAVDPASAELKALCELLPTIMLVGESSELAARDGTALLRKPFSVRDLVAALDRLAPSIDR